MMTDEEVKELCTAANVFAEVMSKFSHTEVQIVSNANLAGKFSKSCPLDANPDFTRIARVAYAEGQKVAELFAAEQSAAIPDQVKH